MIRKLIICALCVLALVAGFILYFVRPIFPTGNYVALVTSTNRTTYAASVYRPLMMPQWLIVNVPDVPESLYPWFGVDLENNKVGAGIFPRRRFPGLLYVSRIWGTLGIGILDPKIEDDWKVAFMASGVAFSNAWLRVQLDRK